MTTGQQLWIENVTIAPWAGNVNTGYAYGDGVFTVALKSVYAVNGYSHDYGKAALDNTTYWHQWSNP